MKSLRLAPVYAVDAAFEASRMLVGGISAVYLLSKGVSVGDLALIKSVQAVILLCGDLPAGVIADRFGHKQSMITATLAAISSFILYFYSSSLVSFCIAEGFAAISLCFWSGAFEAFALEQLGQSASNQEIDKFFHVNSAVTSASIVVAGAIGGLIAGWSTSGTYLVAATSMFFVGSGVLATKNLGHHQLNSELRKKCCSPSLRSIGIMIRDSLSSQKVIMLVGAVVLLQFYLQPLLHLWQPLFLSIDPALDTSNMGYIFSIYCAAQSLTNYLMSRTIKHKKHLQIPLVLLISGIGATCYWLVGNTSTIAVAIAAFTAVQASFAVVRATIMSAITRNIPATARASVLSTVGVLSRLGMILSLWILRCALGSTNNLTSNLTVRDVFSGYGICLVTLTSAWTFWTLKSKTQFKLVSTEASAS
ncbi:MAG: MFS transporter [Proteobacteria bacterium]|nr:MFS transporter [Pseudomonadota bacterium]